MVLYINPHILYAVMTSNTVTYKMNSEEADFTQEGGGQVVFTSIGDFIANSLYNFVRLWRVGNFL